MEKLTQYRANILAILEQYAAYKPANLEAVTRQVIADTERDHYQLVTIGWDKGRFIHHVLFHFDIVNEKIWIQQNWTEAELGEMLQEMGVPKTDIVIGFLPEDARALSDYAVN